MWNRSIKPTTKPRKGVQTSVKSDCGGNSSLGSGSKAKANSEALKHKTQKIQGKINKSLREKQASAARIISTDALIIFYVQAIRFLTSLLIKIKY